MPTLPRLPLPRDPDTLLRHALPRLAEGSPGRRVAFASCDRARGVLLRRWISADAAASPLTEMDALRLHPLLRDDAGGDRPFREVEGAPAWMLGDLLPGVLGSGARIRVRAMASDGHWLGVLLVAEPRRWRDRDDAELTAAADLLELQLGYLHLQDAAAEAARTHRDALDAQGRRWTERVAALEDAAGRATELLMDAHVELARQSERGRRQARVLFLLRRLLDASADGTAPGELIGDCVRRISEAFGGGRCSILLLASPAECGGDLRVAASLGLPAGVDPGAVRVPLGRGISGEVARSGREVVVRDVGEAARHSLGRDAAYRGDAFVSVPLRSGGRTLGVLNLTNFRSGTCGDAELELLRLVALCIGAVVERAELAARLFGAGAAA